MPDDDEDVEPTRRARAAEAPTADRGRAAPAALPRPPLPAPRPGRPDFDAADATTVLIAWWTKMRPDQIGAADSIESLCDGASSRRNQLLVDLGGELGLGAIDGAADADCNALSARYQAGPRLQAVRPGAHRGRAATT